MSLGRCCSETKIRSCAGRLCDYRGQPPLLQTRRRDWTGKCLNHLEKNTNYNSTWFKLPAPEGEDPPVGNWLYGRIENRFGFLLAQYVDSTHGDNIPPIRYESSMERVIGNHATCWKLRFFPGRACEILWRWSPILERKIHNARLRNQVLPKTER